MRLIKLEKGFTLAEVLITLGIIGVVAAMTLPSVVNKYRIKQLETGFKRSSSMIQNALNETAFEFGVNNYKDFNSICSGASDNASCRDSASNREQFSNISDYFISRFKNIKKISYDDFLKNNIPVKTYLGSVDGLHYNSVYGISWDGLYLLPDGTAITSIAFFVHNKNDGISLSFDTNGPYKGPNRYGYDIFLFNTGGWNKLCNNTDRSIYNGRGCYDFAMKDVNSDDQTKGYWESLKF